jgi:hypothetical protein
MFLQWMYHSIIWVLWRRKIVFQWFDRMETSRKLFPFHYHWSLMRATADVLASVQQKLVFYANLTGGANRFHEVKAVRRYEAQLVDLLEQQVIAGEYSKSEAEETVEMLADYTTVHGEKCKTVLARLGK